MKSRYQILTSLTLLVVSFGCSSQRKLTVHYEDMSERGETVQSATTVKFYESSSSRVKYSNSLAIEYAKRFASQDSNSCNVFLYDPDPAKKRSDCAHFIAHALAAGGIVITKNASDPKLCPDGLAYRNTEVVAALRDLASKYENVREIPIEDAIIGDIGFFNKFNLTRPTHGFMICKGGAVLKDFTVYAHTARRNCEKMEPDWKTYFDASFRLEDGP